MCVILQCTESGRREKTSQSAHMWLHREGIFFYVVWMLLMCYLWSLQISFGQDFEQQLSFFVETRAAFCNLDYVLIYLIHVSIWLYDYNQLSFIRTRTNFKNKKLKYNFCFFGCINCISSNLLKCYSISMYRE